MVSPTVGTTEIGITLQISCLSPSAMRGLEKENICPQVNQAAAPLRPERVNTVQKSAFLDLRLNTGAFVASLEENH
jgi:hypothetical protein